TQVSCFLAFGYLQEPGLNFFTGGRTCRIKIFHPVLEINIVGQHGNRHFIKISVPHIFGPVSISTAFHFGHQLHSLLGVKTHSSHIPALVHLHHLVQQYVTSSRHGHTSG